MHILCNCNGSHEVRLQDVAGLLMALMSSQLLELLISSGICSIEILEREGCTVGTRNYNAQTYNGKKRKRFGYKLDLFEKICCR